MVVALLVSFQVSAMVKEGFLRHLVPDVSSLPAYWEKFLMDYPEHPMATASDHSSTFGMTLYSSLVNGFVSFLLWMLQRKLIRNLCE